MRKFSIVAVIFSLLAGAGGYILRCLQLENAFEPLSGLAIRGAESTFRLHILILAFFVIIIIFAAIATARFRPYDNFEETYGTHSVLYPLVLLPVCIVWYYGTIIEFLDFYRAGMLDFTNILFIALSALAATCVMFFSIGIFQNPKHKILYPLGIVPIVFFCFCLFMLYRDNATNPVLLSFVYQCIAIVASTLCFYYIAGTHFGKASIGKAIVAYSSAIFFCGITLADKLSTGMLIILGSIIAIAAIHLFLLLRSLVRK